MVTATPITSFSMTAQQRQQRLKQPATSCRLFNLQSILPSIQIDNEEENEEDLYRKALQEASMDPKSFEAFVLKSKSQNDDTTKTKSDNGRGYVPIEEWNENKKGEKGKSWEDRVQFDGQRYGDKYQQNEIIRKNLQNF